MVMEGDSCSEIKSEHHIILDEYSSHLFVVKVVMFV